MKAVILLSALVFSSVLFSAAQHKEKKDDVYPVALPGNHEQFAALEKVGTDVETGFKIKM